VQHATEAPKDAEPFQAEKRFQIKRDSVIGETIHRDIAVRRQSWGFVQDNCGFPIPVRKVQQPQVVCACVFVHGAPGQDGCFCTLEQSRLTDKHADQTMGLRIALPGQRAPISDGFRSAFLSTPLPPNHTCAVSASATHRPEFLTSQDSDLSKTFATLM
jgi:hypothetical protein